MDVSIRTPEIIVEGQEQPSIRQQYKMAALQGALLADFASDDEITPNAMAAWVGAVADAMLAEDWRHEDKE